MLKRTEDAIVKALEVIPTAVATYARHVDNQEKMQDKLAKMFDQYGGLMDEYLPFVKTMLAKAKVELEEQFAEDAAVEDEDEDDEEDQSHGLN